MGSLYPKGTKTNQYLSLYAQQFDSIELNSTFYAIPKQDQIHKWVAQVGQEFRFCPKVTRSVTEGLGGSQWRNDWQNYCWSIAAFGHNLGLCFGQLPESFGPSRIRDLATWLQNKPAEMPLAIEFRHRGWFADSKLIDPAIDLLYRYGVATVITETPGRLDVRHLSLTQPRVLIRFNGHRLHPSDKTRLTQWAERLAGWRAKGLDTIYFCVHQPGEDLIPQTVRLFREQMDAVPV